MANPFDVDADWIRSLDEVGSRELIARLCRAELRSQELSEVSTTWGGDSRAPDGGVDVRVTAAADPPKLSFLPGKDVAFQVKSEVFGPAKIAREMAPKNVFRVALRELAEAGGTYIIASTRDSCSDSALADRRRSMTKCLEAHNVEGLSVEFFDSRRIADWVEQHPVVANWLRSRVGHPLTGWQTYGPWAYSEDDASRPYIVDEKVRVFTPDRDEGASVIEAITRLRHDLAARHPIRVVGLSGVGKTRLVQAVFDQRVETSAVPPLAEDVIYTDLADAPDPQPSVLINQLARLGSDAVVVIDNCSQSAHARLAEIVRKAPCKLRFISIEYDIRDDLPEGTSCYRLDCASGDLIEKLLKARYPILSESDVNRIAEFSDGNARVAFALAATAQGNGEFAALRDETLSQRLFEQKYSPNDELLRCAEIASLLYSFDAENLGAESELALLASLADVSINTFSRNIAELRRRGLVQARGEWRAVLPHAIANRLASRALATFPRRLVTDQLVTDRSPRIARSFTRRLGFLHTDSVANEIARDLFGANGLLGDALQFGELHRDMFANLAPVDTEAALDVLERATAHSSFVSTDSPHRARMAKLLRSIAYEPQHFDRATSALTCFALAEPSGYNRDSTREIIRSLFYCLLSGTQASPQQRVEMVERLIERDTPPHLDLAVDLLRAGLTSDHFSSGLGFEFGARSRDFGWRPQTDEQVRDWYGRWINLAVQFASGDSEHARSAGAILGRSIRFLWGNTNTDDLLRQAAEDLSAGRGWPEGWLGVRQTLYYKRSELDHASKEALREIEAILAPPDLEAEVRARVLAGNGPCIDYEEPEDGDDSVSDRLRRAESAIERLGYQAAGDQRLIACLLPELLASPSSSATFYFGHGVGLADAGVPETLSVCRSFLETREPHEASLIFVRGIISGWTKSTPALALEFLDRALEDEVWLQWFVELQVQSKLDPSAYERLLTAAAANRCPVGQFFYLGTGRNTDALTPAQIIELLGVLLSRTDDERAFHVVMDVLAMVIHCTDTMDRGYCRELRTGVCELLANVDWPEVDEYDNHLDYELDQILNFALGDECTDEQASEILAQIMSGIERELPRFGRRRKRVLSPFFAKWPKLALETVCKPGTDGSYNSAKRMVSDVYCEHGETAISQVPSEVLIAWCGEAPDERFAFAAATCNLYLKSEDKEAPPKLAPIAFDLLRASPNKERVLDEYVARIHPNSWSNSLADILEKRLQLLLQLNEVIDPVVASKLEETSLEITRWIKAEREREAERERRGNTSFE